MPFALAFQAVFISFAVVCSRTFAVSPANCYNDDSSSTSSCLSLQQASQGPVRKYLLYDVNPGEGFNLRRDVYMRVARLVSLLNEDTRSAHWSLVLPPWGPLYHWRSKNIGYQGKIKWREFFDVSSLRSYVPVVEFEDFLHGENVALFALTTWRFLWCMVNHCLANGTTT